ncbi:MAG TPA: response regulator transcription factor [Bryobacteraceae bacterium]|nr:response regulator transcription factor [Bryobacteraceae bacterium]
MNSSRILVVDDEPQLRRALRSTLSALGFIVDDAETGEAALEKLREERFDLLLLDINLPGLSGIETCRAVRARSDISVLMLTVRDRAEDKIQALDAGADGYVTKPFDVNELLARVRAALRRAPASVTGDTQVLRLDGIEINLRDRRVSVNGRVVRLTPTELGLLGYFVAHPNVVLPHDKILQAVWGPDYGDEVEYLRVYVNQLRKKIEPDPSRPRYILTEPWLGYRFDLPATNTGAI